MYENAVTPDYVRVMATYNQTVNRSLFGICGVLSESERRQEFPLYFKSIHGILNHALWADRIWLARFTGGTIDTALFGQDIYPDFADLCREREKTDAEITAWAETVNPEWLSGPFSWTAINGKEFVTLAAVAVIHLFNHQTYHRGQLSSLLSHLGHEGPTTDIVALFH